MLLPGLVCGARQLRHVARRQATASRLEQPAPRLLLLLFLHMPWNSRGVIVICWSSRDAYMCLLFSRLPSPAFPPRVNHVLHRLYLLLCHYCFSLTTITLLRPAPPAPAAQRRARQAVPEAGGGDCGGQEGADHAGRVRHQEEQVPPHAGRGGSGAGGAMKGSGRVACGWAPGHRAGLNLRRAPFASWSCG